MNECTPPQDTPNSPVLAAMEDKIDKITSILKTTQVRAKKDQKGNKKQDSTPEKKVDATAKATSGKKGFEGRCWKCGGWGHPMRECPTQGDVQWENGEKAKACPKDQAEDPKPQ